MTRSAVTRRRDAVSSTARCERFAEAFVDGGGGALLFAGSTEEALMHAARAIAFVLAPLLLIVGACKPQDGGVTPVDGGGVGGPEPPPDLSAIVSSPADGAVGALPADAAVAPLPSDAGLMEPPPPIEVHTRVTIPARIEAEEYNRA